MCSCTTLIFTSPISCLTSALSSWVSWRCTLRSFSIRTSCLRSFSASLSRLFSSTCVVGRTSVLREPPSYKCFVPHPSITPLCPGLLSPSTGGYRSTGRTKGSQRIPRTAKEKQTCGAHHPARVVEPSLHARFIPERKDMQYYVPP